jgi:hypothetical protein
VHCVLCMLWMHACMLCMLWMHACMLCCGYACWDTAAHVACEELGQGQVPPVSDTGVWGQKIVFPRLRLHFKKARLVI